MCFGGMRRAVVRQHSVQSDGSVDVVDSGEVGAEHRGNGGTVIAETACGVGHGGEVWRFCASSQLVADLEEAAGVPYVDGSLRISEVESEEGVVVGSGGRLHLLVCLPDAAAGVAAVLSRG